MMCIWYMEGEEHPMIKISQTILEFLTTNNDATEDELKDHLADEENTGRIKGCGCEGMFELKVVDGGYQVIIEPHQGSLYKVTIINGVYEYENTTHSDIEGYGEIVINDNYELTYPTN